MADAPARHVVVVGGGIAGLSAAFASVRDGGPGVRVTLFESSSQVGGKLRVSEVAGVPVDEGAEALLARRPEAVDLAKAVGLGDDLVPAETTSASVWSRGRLHALPAGTVMGVPTDLRALSAGGLLTARELARVPLDTWLPRTSLHEDVAVGAYVAKRLGRAVVDRLVEPLLGGVYAGRADRLSFEATMPQLFEHAGAERSLLSAARLSRLASTADGPVFVAPRGGVGRLAQAVADRVREAGGQLRTGSAARELRRTPTGWSLTVGSAHAPEVVEATAVVVALPSAAAGRLLRREVPAAASELAQMRAASTAVVTLALPTSALPALPRGSGFLVPPVEGRLVKGVTFSSSKWGWYAEAAPGMVLVRLSVGRAGEEADLQRSDDELVEAMLVDLTDLLGLTDPPIDARVTRWGGGLPQYAVGHRARVDRVRAAVAGQPGLAVCGATYDGIGVPAVIASGARAAAEVLDNGRHD